MSGEGTHTEGTMGEVDLKLMESGFFEREHIAREAGCIHSEERLSAFLHVFDSHFLTQGSSYSAGQFGQILTLPCLLPLSGVEEIWQVNLYFYRNIYIYVFARENNKFIQSISKYLLSVCSVLVTV